MTSQFGEVDDIHRLVEKVHHLEKQEAKQGGLYEHGNKPRHLFTRLNEIRKDLHETKDELRKKVGQLKDGGKGQRALDPRLSKMSALILLCSYREVDYVKLLLDNGAIEDINYQSEDGTTALMMASSSGHTEIVRLLLSKSPKLDLKDNYDDTALSFADNVEIATLLLDAGAEIDCCDPFQNPLLNAVRGDKLDMVKLLVTRGADITNALDMLESVPPPIRRPEILEYLHTRKPLTTPNLANKRRKRSGSKSRSRSRSMTRSMRRSSSSHRYTRRRS
jgi:ankyrin repeat protein